jgi:hypothetical protein
MKFMLHNQELKSKGEKPIARADLDQTEKEGVAVSPSYLVFKAWAI